MPIQPIDLQTLFAHLNQVGKEQSVLKEGAVLQQAVKGSELVKETQHKDESVNTTKSTDAENQKIKDSESREGGTARGKEEEEEKEKEEKNKKMKKQYFSDPALGKNIDISG